MLNEKLLKAALIGTAQSPPIPLEANEEIEFADHAADQFTDESHFLLRIGRHAIYQTAGQIPDQVPALKPAPESDSVDWSDSILDVFAKVFSQEQEGLLPEFLNALLNHDFTVPEKFIPLLLDLKPSLSPSDFLKVIGPRGVWLSQFNPDWEWINSNLNDESEDEERLITIWNEGTFPERLAALKLIRQVHPEAARELLFASFNKEKADNRKQLLLILKDGLCSSDSEFLEQALSDRSKYVKQESANLLGRISGSEVNKRNLQRAQKLIHQQESSRTFKLTCSPPQEISQQWEDDGLAMKPSTPRGQRAFWIEELVSKIPLSFWEERFSATPVQLINGILNDDYAHAVLTGWTRALPERIESNVPNEWLEPLWKYWSAMIQHPQQAIVVQATEQLSRLANKTPSEKRSHLSLQIISEQHDPTRLPVSMMIQWLPGIWSKKFSHEYLKISRTLTATRSDRAVYEWLQSLAEAAIHLSPELFEAALHPWKIRDHDVSPWQIAGVEKLIINFQERIQLRARFHQELRAMVKSN